ncbi:hypothetical protein [Methanoculleus sp.]|uniref:hypothetical protein n=1 Tax=Methanoculleus sp. TaxID=90427 RepID=UPI001BD65796|nr:hypothetical protein [Methanoculleus sp.]
MPVPLRILDEEPLFLRIRDPGPVVLDDDRTVLRASRSSASRSVMGALLDDTVTSPRMAGISADTGPFEFSTCCRMTVGGRCIV